MPPRLIAVIATAGGNLRLRDTLRSLAACHSPESYLKTIVIENGPRGDAEAIVSQSREEHPHLACEYLYSERANKSNALNECLAALDENGLLFLTDDDIEFEPGVLRAYAEAAEGCQGGVVFGGPIRVRRTGEAPAALLEFLPPSASGFPRGEYREGHDFLGANWAAFVDDLKAAGGFDPRFGPGSPLTATGQESEMMRQLRRRHCRFQYVPEAVVWHAFDVSGYSIDFLGRRSYRNGLEHGIRLRLLHDEGADRPFGWILAKSRAATLLVPAVSPLARWLLPMRYYARLVAGLNKCRGRLKGWRVTSRGDTGEASPSLS